LDEVKSSIIEAIDVFQAQIQAINGDIDKLQLFGQGLKICDVNGFDAKVRFSNDQGDILTIHRFSLLSARGALLLRSASNVVEVLHRISPQRLKPF
jgi:hypothetical protein